MKKFKRTLIRSLLLLLCLLTVYLVSLWLASDKLTFDSSGMRYSRMERMYYIQFITNRYSMGWDDLSFYKNTSLVHISFTAKNKNSERDKLTYPDINFISYDELQNKLKLFSHVKTPLMLSFYGYTIDDKIVALLNSIPEIQSLSFAHCFFTCSLKDINTSKYFFGLTIGDCTSDRDWSEVLNGIKNFHRLVWNSPLNDNDVSTLFSTQLNVEKLEIYTAFSINALEKPFDNVVISPHLKSISLVNFSISDKDIAFLLSSVDTMTTVQFRQCNTIKRDLVLPENITHSQQTQPSPHSQAEEEETQ